MTGTYLDMQNRIIDELAGRTELLSQVKLEILTAITHYQRQHLYFTEGRDTAVTVAGQGNIAVPTDILQVQRLDITYGGHPIQIAQIGWEDFENLGGTDTTLSGSVPRWFSYKADQFWFYPVPSSAYTLTITYVKQLTTLSADADTNVWMTEGESLIRHRARQAIKINYLNDPVAIGMINDEYFSPMEAAAHRSLLRMSAKRLSKGELATHLPISRARYNIYTDL